MEGPISADQESAFFQAIVNHVDLARLDHTLNSLVNSEETWVGEILQLAGKFIRNENPVEHFQLSATEFECCCDAAKAHLTWYDRTPLSEALKQMILAPVVEPVSMLLLRHHQNQIRFFSKATNKIKNIAADGLRGRTSVPHFVTDSNAYPKFSTANDRSRLWTMNSALYDFHRPKYADKESPYYHYQTPGNPYLGKVIALKMLAHAHLIEALVDPKHPVSQAWAADEDALFQHVWDGKWIRQGMRQNYTTPEPRANLGREFHSMSETEAAGQLVVVALLGSRRGHEGWRRFNRVLVQGGWPWLNRYNKLYAKAVYLVLICLWAAVDQEKLVASTAVGLIMIELVRPLIARDGGGQTRYRIRANDLLKDNKVLVHGINLQDSTKTPTKDDTTVIKPALKQATMSKTSLKLKSKKTPTMLTVSEIAVEDGDESAAPEIKVSSRMVQRWAMAEPRAFPKPVEDLPGHIIAPGSESHGCNHGENVPYHARVKVGHSLQDLMDHLQEDSSIVVAQTLGEPLARDEVAEYASSERILTMWYETFQISQARRLPSQQPTSFSSKFRHASIENVNFRSEIGVLKAGAKADVVVWSGESPNMPGWNDPIAAAMLHANVGGVEHVLVDGEWRKKDFKLVVAGKLTWEAVKAKFLELAERIQRDVGSAPEVPKEWFGRIPGDVHVSSVGS